MNPEDAPFLALSGVTKRFGATLALDGAELRIAAGSVHALLGENGAGKSTLIKILSGVHAPEAGAIRLDGREAAIASPRAAEAMGLRFIHQELNLVPHFDAVANGWIGRRHPRRGPFIDQSAMRARVAEVAARIAPDLPLDRPAKRLTPGQRQMAEIVRALMEPARLVVMDEPTSSLSEGEAERLHAVVRQLAAEGTAVLFISHRLDEVTALCADYTVLRNGRTVGSGRIADTNRDGLVALMSGGSDRRQDSASGAAKNAAPVALSDGATGPRLRAEIAFGPLGEHITFEAAAGEIVGLYGLVGSGRSSLLKLIWGAKPARGRISVDGVPLKGGIASRVARGLAYVPEDRRREALAAPLSIEASLALPHLSDFRAAPSLPVSSRPAIRRFAQDVARRLRLAAASLQASPMTLSGGNQQKLVFGRWLGRRTRVMLADEPTRGVDVGAKAEIHAELRRIATDGAAVIVATSDIEELIALSTRVVVLCAGRITADLAADAIDRGRIVAAAFGHAVTAVPPKAA